MRAVVGVMVIALGLTAIVVGAVLAVVGLLAMGDATAKTEVLLAGVLVLLGGGATAITGFRRLRCRVYAAAQSIRRDE